MACLTYLVVKSFRANRLSTAEGELSCVQQKLPLELHDERMAGLIDSHQQLKVMTNYFSCNPIRRGELVYLKIADNIAPAVRIVRGVPGDKYEVYKVADKADHWRVKINDEDVKAANETLELVSKFAPALRTYQISRQGILRENEYIIFSNTTPSLSDSSDLGLVGKDRVLGRVFK